MWVIGGAQVEAAAKMQQKIALKSENLWPFQKIPKSNPTDDGRNLANHLG